MDTSFRVRFRHRQHHEREFVVRAFFEEAVGQRSQRIVHGSLQLLCMIYLLPDEGNGSPVWTISATGSSARQRDMRDAHTHHLIWAGVSKPAASAFRRMASPAGIGAS